MIKNVNSQQPPVEISNNPNISIIGRHTVIDGMLACDWSNSGFTFVFSGTGFIVSLGEYTDSIPAYVVFFVDGKRQRFAVVNGSEKLVIEGLPFKRHKVTVLRVTEGEIPLLFSTVSIIGPNSEFLNPPHKYPRKIEFIGDSITAGYGVLGLPSDPTYLTYQQDSTYSYAFIAASSLDAEIRTLCISGKGIICNCEGNREDVRGIEYCDYLTRKGGTVNDGWVPGVVVINLGTNDSGGAVPDEEFTEAAKELILHNRKKYPDAHIIWLYGMMNQPYVSALKNAFRDLIPEDKKLHLMITESIYSQEHEVGANGHPNVRANVRVASELTKKIRSITDWKTAKSEH